MTVSKDMEAFQRHPHDEEEIHAPISLLELKLVVFHLQFFEWIIDCLMKAIMKTLMRNSPQYFLAKAKYH